MNICDKVKLNKKKSITKLGLGIFLIPTVAIGLSLWSLIPSNISSIKSDSVDDNNVPNNITSTYSDTSVNDIAPINVESNQTVSKSTSTRTVLPTDFEGEIKDDGTVSFPDTQESIFVSNNSFATLPNGVFLVLQQGCVLLDTNTNEVIWRLKTQNGDNSSIGINSGSRIFCVQYNPNVSSPDGRGGTIIILSFNGGTNFLVSCVDAETGRIYQQSENLTFTRNTSSDFSLYLYPVQNSDNEYLIISRSYMSSQNHTDNGMYHLSLNDFNITKITHYNYGSTDTFAVLSAAAFKKNQSSDVIYLAQVEMRESGNLYFSIYNNNTGSVLRQTNFLSTNIEHFDPVGTVNNSIANLKVQVVNDDIFRFFSLVIRTKDYNVPYAISYDYSLSSNLLTQNYCCDLNRSGSDYDLRTGYYEPNVDKFITYSSYIRTNTGAVVVFDLDDPANSNMSLGSEQVQIFILGKRDISPFNNSSDRSLHFIPILTSYNNFEESNLLVTKSSRTSYGLFDISKYEPSNTEDYHYAYWTRPKTDGIMTIDGVSDVNLLGLDSSDLNRTYQNELLQLFTQYTQDSTRVLITGNYAGNEGTANYNSPAYYQDVYKGQASVSLYCTGIVYDEDGQYLNINSGDESYQFNNITLTGFYKWTTELKSSTLNLGNESANDSTFIEQYVKDNINDIFKDLPVDFDVNSNIVSIELDTTNPQNIVATITLNKWIDENGMLQTTNKSFDISTNYNTAVKNELLNGEIPLVENNDYNIDYLMFPQSEYHTAAMDFLRNFIKDNFFVNVPDGGVEIKNIEFGTYDNLTGTLEIKSVVISNYYDEGILCSGDSFLKQIQLNTTITGWSVNEPTLLLENVNLAAENYNVRDITTEQLIQLLRNNKTDLHTGQTPNTLGEFNPEQNLIVDTSTIVRDLANNTISVNIAFNYYYNESGNTTSFPYLSKTITISGFAPVSSLATAINDSENTYDVSSDSALASLNTNNITGNETSLLQFLIDNDIFVNLPEPFGIQNIVNVVLYPERNQNTIAIDTITINPYINDRGEEVDEDKTLTGPIILEGFDGVQSSVENSTYLNAPITGDTTVGGDLLASELDDTQVKSALIALLNENVNKFTNLESSITTFNESNVLLVDKATDNQSGTMVIDFTLSKLLINGQVVDITQADVDNISDDFIFSVTLSGFKTLSLWQGLDTTIDFGGENIYDVIVNNQLNEAFDYIQAIRDNLIAHLNTVGAAATISSVEEYINSPEFATESDFSLSYNYNDLDTSTIIVTNPQLDTLSADASNMWSNGVVFNVTNASYLTTNVNLKQDYDPTNNGSITLSEFKNNLSTVNVNDVATFSNLSLDNYSGTDYSNPDLIKISVVNEKANTAQLAFTFKTYYAQDGILTDYTILLEKTFTFASETDNALTLKQTIAASDLQIQNYNSYQLVAALNNGDSSVINNWLSNHKTSLFTNSSGLDNVSLTFDNATIDDTDANSVIMVLCFNNQYHEITITNLTALEPTNITVLDTIPEDVNATNIQNYFNNDINEKAKSFISWDTTSKLPMPTETLARVTSAKVFKLTENDNGTFQVYINFIFNGVYLNNGSKITYASNYVYQIMINNLPANDSTIAHNIKIVPTNYTDAYIDYDATNDDAKNLTNKPNNTWIIIAATLTSSIGLLLICAVIYMFYQHHKQRKVRG